MALFGGSFNPPHIGHVLAATAVVSLGLVDRVLVVPVFEHALGKRLESFEQRLELVRAAFDWLPCVTVSDIEASLGAPSRTLRTLAELKKLHPRWQMRLLIGSDIVSEMSQWHAFDEVRRLAPPLILARRGEGRASAGECMLPEVSSTEVRALLAARPAPDRLGPPQERLRALVPAAVLEIVLRRGLYRAG